MINFASLNDLDEIHRLLGTASAEILPVPRAELRTAIINGRCVWEEGVAIIFNRPGHFKYYGIPVGENATQIDYIVSRDKGTGAGSRVFKAFLNPTPGRHYLLVKSDNTNAIVFYTNRGFKMAKLIKFKTFNSFLMVRHA